MASLGNGKTEEEIQPESGSIGTSDSCKNKEKTPLYTETSNGEKHGDTGQKNKLSKMLSGLSITSAFTFRSPGEILASPSIRFRQLADERDEISRSITSPSEDETLRNSRVPFARKIDWGALLKLSKEWIRDPLNMVLFAWIICVAVSGAILFMVMVGMLNHALPSKSQRDSWFEINNQILNALFTLMCLYQHPKRFHHLALLFRWSPKDILSLRKIYCKHGTYKPHEWAHMMVVVILLHINCFAQYALCGLNLGYRRSQRPPIGVAICISVAIAAPAIATVYNILSPLGRDYDYKRDEESQTPITRAGVSPPCKARIKSLQKRYSFVVREDQVVSEGRPQWIGGLFDLWDDLSLAYLSIFCSFCVFGWNMDRLGFGNMYVHVATFILLCSAPFWIFNLAALNVDNEVVREALGFTGIILCVFGLLYGGFWRIQMRKKFNLPENKFCCGYSSVTDCFQWLCCCCLSLAQEARTADFYDIIEDKFYVKELNGGGSPDIMSPLRREDGSLLVRSFPTSPLWVSSSPAIMRNINTASPNRLSKDKDEDEKMTTEVKGEYLEEGMGVIATAPPIPSVMHRDDHI